MFKPAARKYDFTFGFVGPIPSFGLITQGDMKYIDSTFRNKARLLDMVNAFVFNAPGFIITGNYKYLDNTFRPMAAITDRFVGTYNGFIITGSMKHFI